MCRAGSSSASACWAKSQRPATSCWSSRSTNCVRWQISWNVFSPDTRQQDTSIGVTVWRGKELTLRQAAERDQAHVVALCPLLR